MAVSIHVGDSSTYPNSSLDPVGDSSDLDFFSRVPICNHGTKIAIYKDFITIKAVARFCLKLTKKFWGLSGGGFIFILFLYWLYGGYVASVLLLFFLMGLLYHNSDKLLYHNNYPANSRACVPSPHMYNLPCEDEHLLTEDNVKIHAVLIKQPGANVHTAPTLLYLHGNAGNIGHRLPNCRQLYDILCCNILLLEYRGYGRSEGYPTEKGLYLDAQAGLDYLLSRKDINSKKILVFGRSLGGAVAIDLCSRKKYSSRLAGVVLENTFTSIPEMSMSLIKLKIIQYIPEWFYKSQFFSIRKVPALNIPCLFISGLADMLIPPDMMKELYNKCGSSVKHLVEIEGGTHNETWQYPGYYGHFSKFLDQVMLLMQDTPTSVPYSNNPTFSNAVHKSKPVLNI